MEAKSVGLRLTVKVFQYPETLDVNYEITLVTYKYVLRRKCDGDRYSPQELL